MPLSLNSSSVELKDSEKLQAIKISSIYVADELCVVFLPALNGW
jgi:hypothetical protein